MIRLEAYMAREAQWAHLSFHPSWLAVMARAFNHTPYALEASIEGKTCGFLVLAFVKSMLFGRFLVSLPYLNYGGVLADDPVTAGQLIDQAVILADRLKVQYLELRHEQAIPHPALNHVRTDKIHMRLDLPSTPGQLWDNLSAKVRNQVRKGQKHDLTVTWGMQDLLPEFYKVFSHNMRDLGTPVYSKWLFANILFQFPERTEICVIRAGAKPIAAGLLFHGRGVTEVPSASSLRRFNHTCANMLLYWHMLERAIQRGQDIFDFGRSSKESNTFRFKEQWGASPADANWQYYLRTGSPEDNRVDNQRYQRLIRLWKRLPVFLTKFIGPAIVRGIP
jgi:FemAB-related protein (PEP-CTERM system-associated)